MVSRPISCDAADEACSFLHIVVSALAAVFAGIFVAVRAKKADDVVYNRLDKTGRITNILLILVYLYLAPMYLFLGMISEPAYGGVLGVIGVIVSILISSAVWFCSLGLGFSVALRKKGKSKLSFLVQFAGLAGIGLAVTLYAVFAGNLIRSLN